MPATVQRMWMGGEVNMEAPRPVRELAGEISVQAASGGLDLRPWDINASRGGTTASAAVVIRDGTVQPASGGSWPMPGRAGAAARCRPVRPRHPRTALTAQYRVLMTQHQDLCVLGRIAASQQRQPAGDLAEDRIQQSEEHERLACRTRASAPHQHHHRLAAESASPPHDSDDDLEHRRNPQLTALRRVLGWYRPCELPCGVFHHAQ